jgi:hypothetical protein
MLDMIKVQHWKLYSLHYNDDDTGIGFEFELKTIQMEYQHYMSNQRSKSLSLNID